MLGGRRSAVEKPTENIDTLLGQEAVFKGDLEFSGGLRIDGRLEGNVTARDGGSSTLVLSELGEIFGDVTVPHVIINGTVHGNVTAAGRVELQAKARVLGDVRYRAIEIALGATVNGNLLCEAEQAGGGPVKGLSDGGASGLPADADWAEEQY